MISNHINNFGPIYSLRLYLRFYVFYLAIINLNLTDRHLKWLNGLIFFLFLLQIPIQLLKFLRLGISEDTIGSYALHGGGITPTVAIVGLGFSIGYYFFYKHNILYIIISFLFISYGILGAKRVLLYMYPIFFAILYFILYIKQDRSRLNFASMIALLFIIVITLSTGALILKYNPTLNPENRAGGSIDLDYALEYSRQYESNMLTEYSSTGRFKTTKIMFSVLAEEGLNKLMFGFGPGSLTSSIFGNERISSKSLIKIEQCYGKTGMVHIVTEYGILGLFSIIIFIIVWIKRSWLYYSKEVDPYWKAFATGCIIFVSLQFIIFFAYNSTPLLNNTISPIFYYALAIIYIRLRSLQQA